MSRSRASFLLYRRRRSRFSTFVLAMLSLALFPALAAALVTGSVDIPFDQVFQAFFSFQRSEPDTLVKKIVWDVRLPRVLAAMLVGGTLAIGGVTLQSLFRNPLAEPYLLGISAGASLGATTAVALRLQSELIHSLGPYMISFMAFLGALLTTLTLYLIGRSLGFRPLAILLLGLSLSFVLSAITAIIQYLNNKDALILLSLLLGSFSSANWVHVQLLSIIVPLTTVLLLIKVKALDTILLGEEYAKQIGVKISRLTQHLVVLTSVLAAVAVAVAGIIGFIGVMVPHIARFLVGYDHRFLLPASLLIGALVLSLSDVAAKLLFRPAELPVGVATSLLGAPILVYLLFKAGGRG